MDVLNTQQIALKIIMNTFYGEAGNVRSPFYSILVAGSVTSKGKELLEHAHNIVSEKRWKVWYGDTDSLYISCPDLEVPKIPLE